PRTTVPSMNVTVPVGVPAPGATAATVAVKVTAWPVTAGLTDDPRATVVDAGLTVTADAAEVLPAKSAVPPETAGSWWLPAPSDTVGTAGPALSCAVPSPGVPSRKVTVPPGPPAGEVTLAVSVSACPNTAVGADARSAVVVAAAAGAFTCSVRACALPAKLASPL